MGLLPPKEVKPDIVITSANVDDVPVNPTVMVAEAETILLANETEADDKAPANMAGTDTLATV